MVPMVRVQTDTDLTLHGNNNSNNSSQVKISFTNLRHTAPIRKMKVKDAGLHLGKLSQLTIS